MKKKTSYDHVLFNCCTNMKAPNWKHYTHLELSGCIDLGGETEGLVNAAKAQFVSVYGRTVSGEVEPITDIHGWRHNAGHLLHVCATLSLLSGLALQIHGTLMIEDDKK